MLPLVANSDTTENLLNQDFSTWSGTNTARHGNSIVAGVHGQYVETEIKLSDTLTEDQIKWGWTSTLGADIYHWNNDTSETEMIQTITSSDGTVTTQSRKITLDTYQPFTTYTDSHIETRNGNTDYTIDVKFNFSESTQSPYHWAVDLENPTLVVEYEPNPVFLSSTQTAQISTVVDNVEEVKIEEFKFEEVKFTEVFKEEIKIEEVKLEEEIKLEEKEFIEETIVFKPEEETIVAEEEVIYETVGETETSLGNGGSESNEVNVEESENNESTPETIEEGGGEESPRVNTRSITVEDVEKRINRATNDVNQRLVGTSLLLVNVMKSDISIDNYGQINNNIFKDQPDIDGGNYKDAQYYADARDIYSESQISYNDPAAEYEQDVQTAVDNRIRAEEHLRRIRGY
jgi:hypothetical protein